MKKDSSKKLFEIQPPRPKSLVKSCHVIRACATNFFFKALHDMIYLLTQTKIAYENNYFPCKKYGAGH